MMIAENMERIDQRTQYLVKDLKQKKKFRLVGEQEAASRSVKDNEKNGIKILKGFWDSGDEI